MSRVNGWLLDVEDKEDTTPLVSMLLVEEKKRRLR